MPRLLQFFVPIITVIFWCFGCTQEKHEPHPILTLTFSVNDSLLGPNLKIGAGICYRMPRGWGKLPDSLFARAFNNAKIPQASLRFDAGYTDPDSKVVVILSTIQQGDTAIARNLLEGYAAELAKEFKVRSTSFLTNDFRVFQILAEGGEKILFRLMFWTNKVESLTQFDFIIPRSYYLANLKRIESVIGSVSVCTGTHQ